jgi:hypothetical protein
MSGPCKYSNALGSPGQGVHAPRLAGLAVADLLGTAGLTYLLTRYGLKRTDLFAFVLVFVILLLVAVILHEVFCVNTRLNAAIFGRPWPTPPSPGDRSVLDSGATGHTGGHHERH